MHTRLARLSLALISLASLGGFENPIFAKGRFFLNPNLQKEIFSSVGVEDLSELCRGQISENWLTWGLRLLLDGDLKAMSYMRKEQLAGFVFYADSIIHPDEEKHPVHLWPCLFGWCTPKNEKRKITIDTICVRRLQRPPKTSVAAVFLQKLQDAVHKDNRYEKIEVHSKNPALVRRLIEAGFSRGETPEQKHFFWWINEPSSFELKVE